ncbi:MAG TPA: hypothetical protein VFS62_09000 [Chloroflexota bacterium]|nr:hypothetical protein [Chloroflexota bacterium]
MEIDPDNVRTVYDDEHVAGLRAALVESLRSNQEYINPPVVYPVPGGKYRVKNGNCRVLAARDEVDSLEVLIEQPPASPAVKTLDQLSENVLQGGLNAMDTARALRKLRDREELSVGGLTDVLQQRGIARGKFWVQMHLGLTSLEPAVQSLVERGELAPRIAYELRNLAPEDQQAWARRIVADGLTLSQVSEALAGGEPGLAPSVEDALRHAAGAFEAANKAGSGRGAGQRDDHGALERRWSLIPLDVPLAAAKARSLTDLDRYRRANEDEQALAHEALALGAGSAEECLDLASRAHAEAAASHEAVMQTLNGLRRLLEQPEVLRGQPALAQLLALRMRRAASTLKRM